MSARLHSAVLQKAARLSSLMLQGDNVRGVSSWLVSIAALKAPVQTFHRFGSTYNKILNSVSHFKITPADDIVLRAGLHVTNRPMNVRTGCRVLKLPVASHCRTSGAASGGVRQSGRTARQAAASTSCGVLRFSWRSVVSVDCGGVLGCCAEVVFQHVEECAASIFGDELRRLRILMGKVEYRTEKQREFDQCESCELRFQLF